MKPTWEDSYEMPEEFDLKKMNRIPNPFNQTFRDLNLVSLDEDVKSAFPDSKSVNDALRRLLQARQATAEDHSEAA